MFRDYMNVFFSILIVATVIHGNSVACQRIPDNPCSDVFRYSRSQNGIYYGEVEIPNDGSRTLHFRVNVSLIGLYQNQNNLKLKIELVSSESDILSKPTIRFRINFPLQNVLPRITEITHNGRVYCYGPQEALGSEGITNLWSELMVQVSNYVYPIQSGAPVQNQIFQPQPGQPQITNVIIEEIDLSQNPFLQGQQPSRPVVVQITDQTERPQAQWPQTQRPQTQWPQTQRPQTQRPQTQRPQTQRPQTQRPQTQRPQTQRPQTQRPQTQRPQTQRPQTQRPQTQRPQTQRPQTQRPQTQRPQTPTPQTESSLHTSKPFQSVDSGQDNNNRPLYVSERLPDGSCGLSNDIQSLIINGESSARNEFPWLVAMFQKTGITFRFHCAANLISEAAVVTAAHCVQFHKAPLIQTEDILLVMGESNLENWVTSKAATVRKASQVLVHPEYKQFTGHCDVAVIKLAQRIDFKWSVRPICLLPEDMPMTAGMQGVVAGWGKDETGKQTVAVPKKVTMKVASQETCLRSNAGFTKLTSEYTFCAGNRDGSGPCTGDSGGGFMITQNGKWFLRGLVSTAVKSDDDFSCNLYEYIVFSDAAKLSTWIKSVMK